jgi:5'-phosphate synthase pdxT subunit
MLRIGLAMLQGARHEHEEALLASAIDLGLEVEIVYLRTAKDVDETIDALVLPGGESTAMRKASTSEGLLDGIYSWMDDFTTRPVLGTCAGAILLAMPDGARDPFIQAGISRNAWGRQRQSFEAAVVVDLPLHESSNVKVARIADEFGHTPLAVDGQIDNDGSALFPGVFIRAPRFESESVTCDVIARLGDEIVGVIDGSKCAVTFHPELTGDRRFHTWLLEQIANQRPTY